MGIDTTWRKVLLENGPAMPSEHDGEPKMAGTLALDDILTRLFAVSGPNYATTPCMFTGRQLYAEVAAKANKAFMAGCKIYIILVDDKAGVPTQKAATQKKRVEADKTVPYDMNKSTITLGDDGITITKTDEEGVTETTTEMVDIRRLMRTRGLRTAMCEYLRGAIEDDLANTLDDDTALVFQYGAVPHVWKKGCEGIDFSFPHPYGEADVGAFQWAKKFSDMDIVYYTTDTDSMPIYARYYEATGGESNKRSFAWVYKRDKWVDFKLFMKLSLSAFGVSPSTLATMFILTGTDFYDKTALFTGYGQKKMSDAAMNMRTTVSMIGNEALSPEHRLFSLSEFLFSVYSKHIKNVHSSLYTSQVTIADKKAKKFDWESFRAAVLAAPKLPKSVRIPTTQDIREASERISWNLHYWNSFNEQPGEQPKKKARTEEEGAAASSSSARG
jgi:hypothetical protein